MLTHHLQKQIIAKLVECETARYADLKPKQIEGNVFTYHLQALLRDKYVEKTDGGVYQLTNKGKLYGINNALGKEAALQQAHSIILLAIRDGNRWLLRRRLVQPMYGKIGFIHGEPVASKAVLETAAGVLQRRTGLSGDYAVRGSGYICLKHDGELLSYVHFTMLEVSNLTGDLVPKDSHGENLWLTQPDFSHQDMLISMKDLVQRLEKPGLFFADLTYDL